MKTKTAGIACSCGSTSFSVIRTKTTSTGWRRSRECCQCGARFTTGERPFGSACATTSTTCIAQIQKSLNLTRDLSSPIPTESQN